jgi:hypothetical protein
MEISLSDTVIRRAGVLSTIVDGCAVLLDSDQQAFVGFDDIGTRIWEAVEKPVKVADLCASLCAHYVAEPPVIESDTVKFLDQLLQQKLVEVKP